MIYKIDSDQKSSNSYHKAMNDAAFKLCLDDPSLLKERSKLIAMTREQVHNEGFQYKKKRSRSKSYGNAANLATDSPVAKRPRIEVQELRSKRIHEIQKDLAELDTRMRYLERSREKLCSMQYEHAAEKSKEMISLRGKRRKLQSEMTQLQKLEAKSQRYHATVSTNKPKREEGEGGEVADA